MRSANNPRSATDIDKKVGENLYKIRSYRRMTQEEVAAGLGVTFQQIQKYERGANRVSVSRLWQLSKLLKVSITEFYNGVEEKAGGDLLTLTPEELVLITEYNLLSEPKQKYLQEFVQFLAKQGR